MITEILKKEYEKELLNGDIERAYVFNVYKGVVTLKVDMEHMNDLETNIETMTFDMPEEYYSKAVKYAADNVSSFYSGCIEIDSYAYEHDAISDFMAWYEGLVVKHYLISDDVTIEDISRLPDGIVYVYIMKDKKIMDRETFKAKAKEALEEIVGKPNGSEEQFSNALYLAIAFAALENKLFE